jgi:hypothetical protein
MARTLRRAGRDNGSSLFSQRQNTMIWGGAAGWQGARMIWTLQLLFFVDREYITSTYYREVLVCGYSCKSSRFMLRSLQRRLATVRLRI